MRPFHVITGVWGDEYTTLFLRAALPTQLTPGNLAQLIDGTDSRYLVHTTAADAARIAAHPAWRRLQALLAAELVIMPEEPPGGDAIARMTACHRLAIARAADEDAGLIFLAPDTVMAEGTLAHVRRVADSGKRVLMCTGVRLTAETFLPAFEALVGDASHTGPAPRPLVALALDHLHANTRSAFVDAVPFTRKPSVIYWPVAGQGLIAHCLHLHPLYVHPVRRAIPVESIDGRFLADACPSLRDYAYLDDSDHGVLFELSRGDKKAVVKHSLALNAAAVATFGGLSCDRTHRRFFRVRMRLKAGHDEGAWSAAEREADLFVTRVRALFPLSRFLETWRDWRAMAPKQFYQYQKTWHRQQKQLKRVRREVLKSLERSLRRRGLR
jgi:hypothetical protein